MENITESFLVVPLGKALSGIPPFWCRRQVAGSGGIQPVRTGSIEPSLRTGNFIRKANRLALLLILVPLVETELADNIQLL